MTHASPIKRPPRPAATTTTPDKGNPMKKLILTVAALAATLTSAAPAVATTPAPAPIIQEDSPLWNCETMGNLVCGPVTAEVFWTLDHTALFIQMWDTHNRIVFGPVLLEGFGR